MDKEFPLPAALLTETLRTVFGSRCSLVEARRLGGGTRKQVFRLDLSSSFSPVVLLVWLNQHDYFDEQADPQGSLSDAVAPRLYHANTRLLAVNGVRVPELYAFDESRSVVPYAYALVELAQGMSFNQYRSAHPQADLAPVLERMKAYLLRLHSIQREAWGYLLDERPHPHDYADETLKDTLPDLSALAQVHSGIGRRERLIRERLLSLRAQIQRRSSYAFIHNELGPDEHFIIGDSGEILMLDIDGCHFADLEREHAYLRLRFGEYYPALTRPGLDALRMDFHQLCLHIGASYGHYRLLQGGFASDEDIRGIYEGNAQKAINFI